MTDRNDFEFDSAESILSPIKSVPNSRLDRARIRDAARDAASKLSRSRPLKRPHLEQIVTPLLDELDLSHEYLGFAMVALSNEFWRPQFAAIPYNRRLLLLPHCLRNIKQCRGTYNTFGLECVSCGACPIAGIKKRADVLGYYVLIAEGTPAVVQVVLSGRADAILGVACLDSLEKAFERVVDLGIPHMAAPLLVDGCVETDAELDQVISLIDLHAPGHEERTRSYVPLLRSAERLFEPGILDALVAPELRTDRISAPCAALDPMLGTEAIALDWLRIGGKRFRPFITLAGYAAMTLGEDALHPDVDLADAFPEVVQRAAIAIEALHKASLVHDDIEDDDAYRYGVETLHRRYGVANAVNVGDYLIGLGYRLLSAGRDDLGADATADMLSMVSHSHVRLSRGQGAELLWRTRDPREMRPLDLLTIYALKTAPAFESALYVGLRAARAVDEWKDVIAAYSRHLGVAYQVLNDLKDWRPDNSDKLVAGQDLLSMRPTVLLTFALESGDDASNHELVKLLRSDAEENEKLERLRAVYEARGVFDRSQKLVDKYRERAAAAATGIEPPALAELMHFIVDVVLG